MSRRTDFEIDDILPRQTREVSEIRRADIRRFGRKVQLSKLDKKAVKQLFTIDVDDPKDVKLAKTEGRPVKVIQMPINFGDVIRDPAVELNAIREAVQRGLTEDTTQRENLLRHVISFILRTRPTTGVMNELSTLINAQGLLPVNWRTLPEISGRWVEQKEIDDNIAALSGYIVTKWVDKPLVIPDRMDPTKFIRAPNPLSTLRNMQKFVRTDPAAHVLVLDLERMAIYNVDKERAGHQRQKE